MVENALQVLQIMLFTLRITFDLLTCGAQVVFVIHDSFFALGWFMYGVSMFSVVCHFACILAKLVRFNLLILPYTYGLNSDSLSRCTFKPMMDTQKGVA